MRSGENLAQRGYDHRYSRENLMYPVGPTYFQSPEGKCQTLVHKFAKRD